MNEEIIFYDLRMLIKVENDIYTLEIAIASGFAEFDVTINIEARDFAVIKHDKYRAALLHAALHRPFQLAETALDKDEQRYYLDKILHAKEFEVSNFLTKLDHGQANGALSNMLRITRNRNQEKLRGGDWFY